MLWKFWLFLGLLVTFSGDFAGDLAIAAPMEMGESSQSAGEPGRQVALVIGNGAYQNTRPLPNPGNDAEDVAKTLRTFGFEVIALKDGSRRQMKEKLAEFSRRIEGASAALVFYAGHGAQIRGENYLIPVDASVGTEAEIMDESISLNRVLDELDGARNRINIVMLDACRDNPVSGKFRNLGRGLAAPTSTPKGTVIVYATEPGNVASDGDTRNSPFTAGLMKAFQGQDLSLDGVLTVASAEVERVTNNRQVPYVNGPKTAQKSFRFVMTLQPSTAQLERDFWLSIQNSQYPEDFEAYLKKYPKGHFGELAEIRFKRLQQAPQSSPTQQAPSAAPVVLKLTSGSVSGNPNRTTEEDVHGWQTTRVQELQQSTAKEMNRTVASKACQDCPEMVLIPQGCFLMGSPEAEKDRENDESPQHRVCVKAFELGKTEVTQAQWKAVMEANPSFSTARMHASDVQACDTCPVESVSWNDIQEFLRRLNASTSQSYRLPSEAEWEYAARAGTTGPFSFDGPITAEKANYYLRNRNKQIRLGKKSEGNTDPAGSLPENPWGLHEMHGNVFEWVQDCYHDSYLGAPDDGNAWETDCEKEFRVFRGGSWDNDPAYLRSADRNRVSPDYRYVVVGFRLARTMPTLP